MLALKERFSIFGREIVGPTGKFGKETEHNKYILMCLNSLFYSSITFKPFSSNKYNMQWVVIRPAFIVLFQFPCMFFHSTLFSFFSRLFHFLFQFFFCLCVFTLLFLLLSFNVFQLFQCVIVCVCVFFFFIRSFIHSFSFSCAFFQTVFETIYIYILIFCIISYLLIKRNFTVSQKQKQKLNR